MATSFKDTLVELGKIYRLGQFATVLERGEALIKEQPDSYELWNICGAAQNALAKYRAAYECFQRARDLKPHLPEAHLNLAIASSALGSFEEAIAAARKALEIKPDYPQAHLNIGSAHKEKGYFSAAQKAFERALACDPNYAEAHNGLGIVLRHLGAMEGAERAFAYACSTNPRYADAHNNLGAVCLAQNRPEEALKAFLAARDLQSNYPSIHSNIGSALAAQGRFDEALPELRKALALRQNSPAALNNIGIVLRDLGKPDEAISCYVKALALQPDYPEAQTNKSFAHLLKGDLQIGFELMEYRLRQGTQSKVQPPRPGLDWDGKQDIKGARFHVYQEQGYGDIIQFARYLSLLEARGAEVSLLVTRKLNKLLRTMAGNFDLVTKQPAASQIDFETPLMSLPHLFGTTLDTVPAAVPYMQADQVLREKWTSEQDATSFRIGICWQGSKARSDLGRSFSLSLFHEIAKIPNVELISLHKGAGEDQLRNLPFEVTTFPDDFDAGEDAFADTAAVMTTCDLIITSDTAVAHLAGALGCRTWVVLQAIPNWRWLMQRCDSPWYPSVVLYRQEARGDWQSVFDRLIRDLSDLIHSERPERPAPLVQVSWGEVIDKISILKIKASKLTDPNALKNVQHELGLLNSCCARLCPDVAKGIEFELQLIEINLKLWDIEDNLRSKEKRQEFDEEFVALARQVYLTNDERARMKQLINIEFPSGLREEKSYLSQTRWHVATDLPAPTV